MSYLRDMDDVINLTAESIAAEIGVPTNEWAGSCHAVSTAVAPLVGGTVRRGIFTGDVNPDSYFGKLGRFAQHSWVELPNGDVLDPTRHAFVGGEPVLWIGPSDEYDIGGCKTADSAGPPPSQDGPADVLLWVWSFHYFDDLLEHMAEGFIPIDADGAGELMLTVKQALWLANLPVKDTERPRVLARWFAAEAYEALVRAGQRALIPIDRLDWILPEHGEVEA